MKRAVSIFFLIVSLLVIPAGLEARKVVTGDIRFSAYLPDLKGRRVAVFSNQTGIAGDRIFDEKGRRLRNPNPLTSCDNPLRHSSYGQHIVDALLERNVNVSVILSPEHGFRGDADAGEKVLSSVDESTGVPVLSLYGNPGRPSADDMAGFDVLLIDIQDVGLRYYTYYVTMYRLMGLCAEYGKKVIVLDRPNPNGFYVDGPVLDMAYKSGVGALPIPVVHGMTLGELALMINGEGWLKDGVRCDLKVVPCKGYSHQTKYSLIIPPSPNLKTMRAVYLYSSVCFFEGSAVSLGRGTDHPFEMYGSPDMKGCSHKFTPVSMPGAKKPDYQDQCCYGRDLRTLPVEEIWREGVNLEYVIDAYRTLMSLPDADSERGVLPDGRPFFGRKPFIDKLIGNSWVREKIISGADADEIRAMWSGDVESFREKRKPYLLYSE